MAFLDIWILEGGKRHHYPKIYLAQIKRIGNSHTHHCQSFEIKTFAKLALVKIISTHSKGTEVQVKKLCNLTHFQVTNYSS